MNRDEEIRIMSLPKMQEKFREAMGPIADRDRLYCPGCNEEHTLFNGGLYYCGRTTKIQDMIRLPLPIDPVNPERGVLGMLRGRVSVMSSDGYTPTLAHQWNVGVEG